MKSILISSIYNLLLSVLLVSIYVYCGWSGDGSLFVRITFLAIFFILFLSVFFIGYFVKTISKVTTLILIVFIFGLLSYLFITLLPSVGVKAGRYLYWKINRNKLQNIACRLTSGPMKEQQLNTLSAQLKYPIIMCLDKSNNVQYVVFAHWRTSIHRDIGFVYQPFTSICQTNDAMIKLYFDRVKSISKNWFIYSNSHFYTHNLTQNNIVIINGRNSNRNLTLDKQD